jgi:hypothetical protein
MFLAGFLYLAKSMKRKDQYRVYQLIAPKPYKFPNIGAFVSQCEELRSAKPLLLDEKLEYFADESPSPAQKHEDHYTLSKEWWTESVSTDHPEIFLAFTHGRRVVLHPPLEHNRPDDQ